MANILKTEKRVAIVKALAKGCSIRASAQMSGTSKNTVTKLLVELGEACSRYQDETLRGLSCKRVRAGEIWSFVGTKEKTAKRQDDARPDGVGEVWTWTAIDADTKLVLSWLVGARDFATAKRFVDDLASRLTSRIQLTTDGLRLYLEAVEGAFGADVDYAMLVKPYGEDPQPEKRYSPARLEDTETPVDLDGPAEKHISTGYVQRQNLGMRRFTRLPDGFSKKEANHVAAISLYFMVYNFVKPHRTLTADHGGHLMTPAMAAGVAGRPRSYENLLALLDSS